jgi:hypothetical protein
MLVQYISALRNLQERYDDGREEYHRKLQIGRLRKDDIEITHSHCDGFYDRISVRKKRSNLNNADLTKLAAYGTQIERTGDASVDVIVPVSMYDPVGYRAVIGVRYMIIFTSVLFVVALFWMSK